MRFVIDAREAFRTQKTGKGQWTKGFLTELLQRGIALELLLDEKPEHLPEDVSFRVFASGLRWHVAVAGYLRSLSEEIIYISPTSFIVPALTGKHVRTITVVHDLIAFRKEPHDRKARIIEKVLLSRIVKTSVLLCTVSESTKSDLLERFPHLRTDSVVPIYAGPIEEAPKLNEPDGKTILSAGTLCPRKNQYRLVQAYAQLPQELRDSFRLILVGARGWKDQDILDLVKKTDGVEWRSYASDQEYISLLHTCTVFALPSLYEGFGMQILDALQRGIPVVTSARGSLKEVAGDAAVTVDPDSVDAIENGLRKLLQNDDVRKNLRQRGPTQAQKFSWKKTADLFLVGVKSLLY